MKRTNKDVMYALFEELVGVEKLPIIKENFERQYLATFPNKKINQEIPEEEYQETVKNIKKEAPAFAAYLENNDFPELPSGFGKHN